MAQSQTNFEMVVEKMIYGGDGLARVDGRVVLAPFVLPGERVAVEQTGLKPGLLRARLVEVRESAPARVAAECRYFGRCGGCHYQHAAREAQLEFKRAILVESLERVGKIDAPDEIRVIASEPWGYRNRVQLHINGSRIGYFEAHSNRLCAVDDCPVASPAINRAIAALREMLPDPRWPRFVRSIELFTNETGTQINVLESDRPLARRFFDWCAEKLPGFVEGALDYPAAGSVYRVSGGSFFQVNRFLLSELVEAALEGAEGGAALDLYAGVGLFTLPLARRCARVTAVDSSAGAVRDLRFNAERAGITIEARAVAVDTFVTGLTATPDFVLADPPRSGLGRSAVLHLARLGPPRITIVACDPATLARDLAGLLAAGYKLDGLTMIDLFPQTYHIEAIARLSR